MTTYWANVEQSPLENYTQGHFGAQHELDDDNISYPGSVPMPNEDFEPFLSEYSDYNAVLEQSMTSIQDLGIGQALPSVHITEHAASDDFSMLKPATINKYAYSMNKMATSPAQPRHRAVHPAHLMSPPPQKPQFDVDGFQGFPHSQALPHAHIHSHAHGHPGQHGSPHDPRHIATDPVHGHMPSDYGFDNDIPSSPPGSPGLHSELVLGSEPDPLGIQSIPSSSFGHMDRPTLRAPPHITSPPSSPMMNRRRGHGQSPNMQMASPLAWQPILTIPDEAQAQSELIIRSQAIATSESKTRRKSCLPPGTVDEYVGGPDNAGIYECRYPMCGRLFRRRYNLRSHIQTHLCDRPYRCEFCQATFVRPHDLRRHARCHSQARPYACPCGKGFTRMDALQRHRHRQICKGGLDPNEKGPRSRTRDDSSAESESSPILESDSEQGSPQ